MDQAGCLVLCCTVLRQGRILAKSVWECRIDELNPPPTYPANRLPPESFLSHFCTAQVSGRLEGGREILIDQPIICESKRWARYCVDPAGKSAQTLVSEVVYDETKGESILLCEPLTGR